MAGMKDSVTPVDVTSSRRRFIGALAAATAATALPTPASARSTGEPSWGACRGGLAEFRRAYLAEVERFAEELRPRFGGGKLRGMTDEEMEDGQSGRTSPYFKLEALCAARFGCAVTRDAAGQLLGDVEASHLVLAFSPHAEIVGDNWEHPGYHATTAVTWDVLEVARERGMYVPLPTEEEDPLITGVSCTG